MTSATPRRIERAAFGVMGDGAAVERVTLRGEKGFEASIITLGASLQSLKVCDRAGRSEDVVLGHDDLAPYIARRQFFGATVGRYANRIAGARFTLDGTEVRLEANDGANCLHGGVDGFDRKLWRIVDLADQVEPTLVLTRESPDGEEGFPGRLDVRATYRVSGESELTISYEATTDRPTVVNLTNHSFFNLDGASSASDILAHRLWIAADHYLAVDAAAIPLQGPPRAVDGTPFDFRNGASIGARIRMNDEQLRCGRGYDHNFCLSRHEGVRLAARLEAPRTGRTLELLTNQPGLQFYSGNFLDGSSSGRGNRLYRQSDALCLEPQAWPDTPNRGDFPSARLDRGQLYRHVAVYRFTRGATS
jgi:aldose 1-epimerase